MQTIWFQNEDGKKEWKEFGKLSNYHAFDEEGVSIFLEDCEDPEEDWDEDDFCSWAGEQKRKGRLNVLGISSANLSMPKF